MVSRNSSQKEQEEQKKENRKVFSVSASPYNAVKLELGVILILAVIIWILVHSTTNDSLIQFIVLAVFGLIATLWIVLRVRFLEQAND